MHYGDKPLSKEEMVVAVQGVWKIFFAELLATFYYGDDLAFLMQMFQVLVECTWHFSLVWFCYAKYGQQRHLGKDGKAWMPTKILISTSYRLVFFAH